MQSWSCDLAGPGGDLNVSQTMNTWSPLGGRGSRRLNVNGTATCLHLPARTPSTQKSGIFPSILFPSDPSQLVVYGQSLRKDELLTETQFTNIPAPCLQNPTVLALKTFVLKKIPYGSVTVILHRAFAESSSETEMTAFPAGYIPPPQHRGRVWAGHAVMTGTHRAGLTQCFLQRGGHYREVRRLRRAAGKGQILL